MSAGATIILAGYAVLLTEPPLALVVAARLLADAGEAGFVIAALTIITDLAPDDRRGEAVSLMTVGSYSGLAVGPVVADAMLDEGGFRLVWTTTLALVLAAGALTRGLPETRPHDAAEAPTGWLPPRAALLPGVLLLFALIGFGGFNALAALYARDVGFERPGLLFALFGCVVIVVRVFGRRLPDRLGPRTTVTVACLLVAAGLGVLGVFRSELGLVIGTAVLAAGQSLAYPAVALLAMERTSLRERSAVLGSVTAFVDVALSLGAFTLGATAEIASFRAAFLLAAVVAAVGLVVLARLERAPPAPT